MSDCEWEVGRTLVSQSVPSLGRFWIDAADDDSQPQRKESAHSFSMDCLGILNGSEIPKRMICT
jgi:hypothetical protein